VLKTHRLEAADALHVSLDASGTVAVCCGADRVVRLVHTTTGQLLACAAGHAEVVTAAALSPDCAQVRPLSALSCPSIRRRRRMELSVRPTVGEVPPRCAPRAGGVHPAQP
jgi:WD40 repeat protein